MTDHDTTAGWDEAVAAGQAYGIEVILCIELSCVDATGTGVHGLAYGVDPDHSELVAALARPRHGRSGRLPRLLAQLDDLGIRLTAADVAQHRGDPPPWLSTAHIEHPLWALLRAAIVRQHASAQMPCLVRVGASGAAGRPR